ncbi:hypothetical protein J1614_002927 [Plenodomus biglobosus]|nr:hypothetical protein J1614_002927 [Plenodomus biglobosus]
MHLFLRRAWHVRTNGVDEAKGPLRAAAFRPIPAAVSNLLSRSTVVKSADEVGDVLDKSDSAAAPIPVL